MFDELRGVDWSAYLLARVGWFLLAGGALAAGFLVGYWPSVAARLDWLWVRLRLWMARIIAPVVRRVMESLPRQMYAGIKIVDACHHSQKAEAFIADTVAVLRLIEEVSPRYFRRIQRECTYITNEAPLWGAGSYDSVMKMCKVNYERWTRPENDEWFHWWYAALLVHEATHGVISSRGVLYTKAKRMRIERLCHREQWRFARRADTDARRWGDALVPPFDERRWHPCWHATWRQKLGKIIAVFRERRRERPGQTPRA